ncbi:hypothetical protein, partial [Bartonella bovis]
MWVMVMRCVFKHHVYLCVVSTALMAGLALITSHTSKAYAQAHNCGSGGVVGTVSDDNKPIVCDSSSGTKTLNSISSNEININMNKGGGSEEAAVTVTGPGTNITIGKTLKVINGSGKSGSLPVIKVYGGGKLTLVEEVDVTKATIKKEIVVDGQGSSVTLNGVLKGFEGVQVKNGGAVTLLKDGVEIKKVEVNNGGMVTLNGNVTFNNDEAGIKIEGTGKASVMGVGKAGEMVTMTVNGKGADGIQMDGDGGTANVVMLNIKGGSGAGSTGTGVDVQNGTMELNKIEVSGFKMGVHANKGTVKLMGESKITVEDGGTGIMVSGSGATVKMMEGSITG